MPRILTLLLALVLGAACALLVSCGSAGNPHLLSSARADRLQSELDDLRNAVDDHDCAGAAKAAQRLEDEVTKLPRMTDPRLQARLQEGAANLRARAAKQCQKTETTPTVTETTPTETETEKTQTEKTQTETTPTEKTQTETTPTETTPTTPTTTGLDGGGTGSGGSTVPPGG